MQRKADSLSDGTVRQIKQLAAGGWKVPQIAAQFEVDESIVRHILRGRS